MKKIVLICATAIICSALFSVTSFLRFQREVQLEAIEAAKPKTVEGEALRYANLEVLHHSEAVIILFDRKTGDLYRIRASVSDFKITKGNIRNVTHLASSETAAGRPSLEDIYGGG